MADILAHFEAFYPAKARFYEIEKIFQCIKEGSSCQLIGLPGVGRGNILNLLAYNRAIREVHVGDNQKWFHFVGVDFSEVRTKPLFEVTKLIFLELVESLHERNLTDAYEKTTQLFKDALSFQDELVLFQALKNAIDYLAIEKELTIVFLFDRFEEYIPMLTAAFFSNLRILRNRAKYRFSVVFSVGRPLEESIEPAMMADFYEFFFGHTIYIPLEDKPTTDFRVQYLEKVSGKTIPEKIFKEIITLTSGHGKLTRLCLEACLAGSSVIPGSDQESSRHPEPVSGSQEKMPKQVRHDNVDELLDFFLSRKPIQGALLEMWYFFTPGEQDDLLEMAKEPIVIPAQAGIQEQEDGSRAKSGMTSNYLQQVFLVKDGKIAIPLFEQFVKEQLSKQPEQKIIYDPDTNTIRHGKDLLSDMLTASEFRLFKLLLMHEGNVVDRQQIVDAVWGELASTQGVTEQAVDQLVFRLRKKIEENPNQPEHILTVKGRGIKFNQ